MNGDFVPLSQSNRPSHLQLSKTIAICQNGMLSSVRLSNGSMFRSNPNPSHKHGNLSSAPFQLSFQHKESQGMTCFDAVDRRIVSAFLYLQMSPGWKKRSWIPAVFHTAPLAVDVGVFDMRYTVQIFACQVARAIIGPVNVSDWTNTSGHTLRCN